MTRPKKYRKKPVIIEAIVFSNKVSDFGALADFLKDADARFMSGPKLVIPTLEGDMVAELGDYIIKGIAGEFYPCKPEIFAATYEEVTHE